MLKECCTGHPPLQRFGDLCVTQLNVFVTECEVCVCVSVVPLYLLTVSGVKHHKCFLFPSDITFSNSFRSLAK